MLEFDLPFRGGLIHKLVKAYQFNSGSVNSSLNSVMTTLYRFTPYSVLTIVPFVFIFEAPHMMTEFAELAYNSQTNSSQIGGAATVLMMLVMGVINYNLPIMYHVFLLNC